MLIFAMLCYTILYNKHSSMLYAICHANYAMLYYLPSYPSIHLPCTMRVNRADEMWQESEAASLLPGCLGDWPRKLQQLTEAKRGQGNRGIVKRWRHKWEERDDDDDDDVGMCETEVYLKGEWVMMTMRSFCFELNLENRFQLIIGPSFLTTIKDHEIRKV